MIKNLVIKPVDMIAGEHQNEVQKFFSLFQAPSPFKIGNYNALKYALNSTCVGITKTLQKIS